MSKRSNLLVIVGLAVFLLGAAVVLITTRSTKSSASTSGLTVVIARQSLSAGTSGDQLVAGNLVETRQVKGSQAAPGALSSLGQLSGRTLQNDVPAGQQVTQSELSGSASTGAAAAPPSPTSPVGAQALQVPSGKQALAVQVPFVAGGAQVVNPGTLVNIYAAVSKATPDGLPCVELALPSVQVLAASTAQASPAPGSATSVPGAGPDIVYVLAVDPGQAQALIFFQKNESMYFTVVPKNQAPASSTGCIGYKDYVHK